MRSIVAAILVALMLGSAPASDGAAIGDSQFYTSGPYGAYNAPFGAPAMGWSRLIDYADITDVQPTTFPDGTVIKFAWPGQTTGCKGSICGFMAVDYGDYDGTAVAVPVPSRALSQIHALTVSLREAFAGNGSGSTAGYDAIVDAFLTQTPDGDSNHLFEVEVFLHAPPFASSWVIAQKPVGIFTDSGGRAWVVTRAGTDILFMPDDLSDITAATLDLRAMLGFLVAQDQVPDAVYFNGLAIGAEPKFSSGVMTINALSIDYN